VRDATAADAGALATFAAAVFAETYATTALPADIAAHLATHFSAVRQGAEIADPARRTWLAEVDGTLAGYAQLRSGTPTPAGVVVGASGPVLELQRLYVGSPWHGRGVAQALMSTCMASASGGLWLNVYKANARAIAFYEKAGFRIVGEVTFVLGTDPQVDFVMQWSP